MNTATRLLVIAIAWPLAASAQTDSARAYGASFDHAAACIAALRPYAAELADRYRAGDESVSRELVALTESSLAIVGVAIQEGLRKDEADMLLSSAEEFQRSVPASKLVALVTACRAEGTAILAEASPEDRARMTATARARISRIRTDG